MSACLRIAWIAVRELLHERVFHLLGFFVLVSLGFSALLGHLTYAEQTKLTLDFMLATMEVAMVLFAVFMSISLFHRELTSGSVAMVLSKPISRLSFIAGKYLGQVAIQAVTALAMTGITIGVVLTQGTATSLLAIAQTGLLIFLKSACLAAATYFFAVNAGAVMASVATLCLFAMGHFRGTVSKNLREPAELQAWHVVKSVLPDFEIFNMKALASYGFHLPAFEVALAVAYAACCIVFFLSMAAVCFGEKDVTT